jgi:hypothetical protein
VSWADVRFDEADPHGRRTGGRLSTARNQESMKTSLLSARQIMLVLSPITAISVARQAREESQRNGRHGA